MKPGEWEALLYDWHNHHRLHNQRRDIAYWLEVIEPVGRTLVLGAGTGRVAVPLARRPGARVTAVDLSGDRLARIPHVPGLSPVCGDMRRLPLRDYHESALMPYSTFQLLLTAGDRQRALGETARVVAPGGCVHIDVSGNFDTRTESGWRLGLAEPCPAVGGARVEEWERHRPMPDHVLIEKVFRQGERVLARVEERWAHHGKLEIEKALDRAGFDLLRVDRGYGEGSSPHRFVYHARRRG
ncbi:class I SAM-dependent methyltransferase [Streptomyces alkaliphilus]|uniref:class I SAM-dependent methyltransferase n=1 Tax=Streptomyces alkaliphilus TaxID=1472722 RepID=UPI001564A021